MPRPVRPKRFRTRLTAAFILVASVATGTLALGSYLTVSEYREHVFGEQAKDEAQLALFSTPRELSLEEFEDLLGEYQRRAGFETVAVVGDVTFSSSPALGPDDIPAELRTAPPSEALRQADVTVGGEQYLVVRGSPPGSTANLYFFFTRAELEESLRTFRNVLAVGWLMAVAGAAAFGSHVAKRTLSPVGAAADAARALAEGLLDTRLERQPDDEFGAWADSFNTMAQALEEKIRDLSRAADRERRFTANVAHDLRTPLTGMSSAASLLEEELPGLNPTARRVAEFLIDDVRRLESLVLELLELARLDVGQDVADLEPLSVRDSLQAVLASWDGQSSSIPVRDADGLWVLADRARFKRVVSNLLANAFDHGAGDVEIVVRREADRVAIDVLDRGPGLSPHDLEHVFDRFYKGDPARAKSGSGLGLAIAWENAQLQGGTLEAANREGGGARFTFWLSCAALSEAGCGPPPGLPSPEVEGHRGERYEDQPSAFTTAPDGGERIHSLPVDRPGRPHA